MFARMVGAVTVAYVNPLGRSYRGGLIDIQVRSPQCRNERSSTGSNGPGPVRRRGRASKRVGTAHLHVVRHQFRYPANSPLDLNRLHESIPDPGGQHRRWDRVAKMLTPEVLAVEKEQTGRRPRQLLALWSLSVVMWWIGPWRPRELAKSCELHGEGWGLTVYENRSIFVRILLWFGRCVL